MLKVELQTLAPNLARVQGNTVVRIVPVLEIAVTMQYLMVKKCFILFVSKIL